MVEYTNIPRLFICQRSEYEGLYSINRFAPSDIKTSMVSYNQVSKNRILSLKILKKRFSFALAEIWFFLRYLYRE